MMTERTCETCGDKGDCSIRHMMNNLGCEDWEKEPRPAAQDSDECKKAFEAFANEHGGMTVPAMYAHLLMEAFQFALNWTRRPSLPMSAEVEKAIEPLTSVDVHEAIGRFIARDEMGFVELGDCQPDSDGLLLSNAILVALAALKEKV
jgi:hypothetical protein